MHGPRPRSVRSIVRRHLRQHRIGGDDGSRRIGGQAVKPKSAESKPGKEPAKEQFLLKADLKARGWTDTLIRRFLPQPDDTRENPHYRSGPPMRLYREARVEAVEKTPELKRALSAARPAKERAPKAVETKRAQVEAFLTSLQIEVPLLSEKVLVERACRSYNAGRDLSRDLPLASPESGPKFLDRIVVNYLRHELTKYEEALREITGRVVAEDAYIEIKTRILDAIAEQYPELSAECSAQEDRMLDRLHE